MLDQLRAAPEMFVPQLASFLGQMEDHNMLN